MCFRLVLVFGCLLAVLCVLGVLVWLFMFVSFSFSVWVLLWVKRMCAWLGLFVGWLLVV